MDFVRSNRVTVEFHQTRQNSGFNNFFNGNIVKIDYIIGQYRCYFCNERRDIWMEKKLKI